MNAGNGSHLIPRTPVVLGQETAVGLCLPIISPNVMPVHLQISGTSLSCITHEILLKGNNSDT